MLGGRLLAKLTPLDVQQLYTDRKAAGLSSTTVARVSRWLKRGAGGYRMILRRAEAADPR